MKRVWIRGRTTSFPVNFIAWGAMTLTKFENVNENLKNFTIGQNLAFLTSHVSQMGAGSFPRFLAL